MNKTKKIVLIMTIVVSLMAFLWGAKTDAFSSNGGPKCGPIAEPYFEIVDQFVKTIDGQQLYVVRAIAGDGKGWVMKGNVDFPSCSSQDPSLTQISNLFIILEDGRVVYILVGVVGGYNPDPLPESPSQ